MRKMKMSIALLLIVFVSFYSCQEPKSEETIATIATPNYMEKGKNITSIAFVALSSQLQKAMKSGGVPNAITYCNAAAIPILDSLSLVHNATIKRTSLNIRNPLDKANTEEKVILENYQTQHEQGQSLKPIINKHHFYAPILVNELCLNCHGKLGETLSEVNYAHILKYYPEDKAIAYSAGDFRGMWSITFKK